MSSTRYAPPGSDLKQGKFASSPVFDQHLSANLVAKRLTVVDDPQLRARVWRLQWISMQRGGIEKMISDILKHFGDRFGTRTMIANPKPKRGMYSRAEVIEIRGDLGCFESLMFKGEFTERESELMSQPKAWEVEYIGSFRPPWIYDTPQPPAEESTKGEIRWEENRPRREAEERSQSRPASYSRADLLAICHRRASSGDALKAWVMECCLNPKVKLEDGGPSYCRAFFDIVDDYCRELLSQGRSNLAPTEVENEIRIGLETASQMRSAALIEGDPKTGKTRAAVNACERWNGLARYVNVPDGNDYELFVRAVAHALGLTSVGNTKVVKLKGKIAEVLSGGDLILCLDHAHRIWPMVYERRGTPSRMEWMLYLVSLGAPIVFVASPQFSKTKLRVDHCLGWNSEMLTRNLCYSKRMPSKLGKSDLMTLAAQLMPEGSDQMVRFLAISAGQTASQLEWMVSVIASARNLAKDDGRNAINEDDLREGLLQAGERAACRAAQEGLERSQKPRSRRERSAEVSRAAGGNAAELGHSGDMDGVTRGEDSAGLNFQPLRANGQTAGAKVGVD